MEAPAARLRHDPLAPLGDRLRAALGPGVGIAWGDVDGDPDTLWPDERPAVARAIERRRREFAAGRSAARRAMAALGRPACAIPAGADRAPVWPANWVGSIAHDARGCFAVAAPAADLHAVGIDLDAAAPLEAGLWDLVCTPDEIRRLPGDDDVQRGRWAKRLFCAKEAYYKWQHPQTHRMLSFHEVEVIWLPDNAFEARPADPRGLTHDLPGRWTEDGTWILAWVAGRARR